MVDLNATFSILSGLGILASGIGFGYSQFTSGGGKAKDDLISTLKETVIVEKDKAERLVAEKATLINSHQQQINELNKQLGILQGTIAANDAKLQDYTKILQGRSPEQTQFMKTMITVAQEATKYMKESSKDLKEIKQGLAKIK